MKLFLSNQLALEYNDHIAVVVLCFTLLLVKDCESTSSNSTCPIVIMSSALISVLC